MITLSIGTTNGPAGLLGHAGRRAARTTLRLLRGLALASVAGATGLPAREHLVAERRDGHIRELESCGRKKACIMKRRSAASARAAAVSMVPDGIAWTGNRRRWSEAQYDRVTVWIAPGDAVPLWRSVNRLMVRDAFHAWTAAGAPVRFVFVPDSARADVRVFWSDSLADGRAGQVTRYVDSRGWLRAAVIEMSTRNLAGGVQDSITVRSVALHEVGHLIGLEHSGSERDIMAPWVIAPRLSSMDRASMRALYGVPAAEGDGQD